jgi:hypothetical protein
MFRLFASACIAACVSQAAMAVEIVGAGTSNCEGWTESRKTDNHDLRLAWINGFLSAMAISSGRELLRNVDPKFIAGWIDRHCAANPRDTLALAADRLGAELYAKAGPAPRTR